MTERRIHESAARCAVTYLEADIVAVGEANARAKVPWARPATDAIARDKRLQRLHLAEPTRSRRPSFLEVRDEDAAIAALADLDGPWIVKPTRGGNSAHVVLADDHRAVRDRPSPASGRLRRSRVYYLYDELPDVWALIEEYLPGDEVTCDGVVIDGHFHLGGIHAKYVGPGPVLRGGSVHAAAARPHRRAGDRRSRGGARRLTRSRPHPVQRRAPPRPRRAIQRRRVQHPDQRRTRLSQHPRRPRRRSRRAPPPRPAPRLPASREIRATTPPRPHGHVHQVRLPDRRRRGEPGRPGRQRPGLPGLLSARHGRRYRGRRAGRVRHVRAALRP